MDINMIMEIITTLGFPIACVLALGYFVYKIYTQSVKREEKLMEEIALNREVNAKAIATITLYAERLTHIENDISSIKTDVGDIKQKID